MSKFVYLVEDLDSLRIEKIKKALASVSEIEDLKLSQTAGMITATAKEDVEQQIRAAVRTAGASFRRKV
jgi:hypothetical protein